MSDGSVTLPAEGRPLDGTLLRPDKLVPGVLFVHGWGGSQEQDLARAEEIAQLGCLCFTFNLRGHAKTEPQRDQVTREDGLEDVLAAYDFLAGQESVDPSAIMVVGTSYGGYLSTLLTTLRPVSWLALRVPALYPDAHWDVPKAKLDKAEVFAYRSHFRGPTGDRALTACEQFRGDVLLVESEFDEHVPHPAIASFVGAFRHANSLSYRVVHGADHAMRAPECRQRYNRILIRWIEEMIRGARRSDAAPPRSFVASKGEGL
ncbi:alpha/beta hydrolase family protein [Sphingomonas sp. ac-8]|uniref:alpha/beta hydrolase family protein n=1 Tax=Sphingomonas sp. ac-8 TaxID=3242977 RepID=UPI003A810F05